MTKGPIRKFKDKLLKKLAAIYGLNFTVPEFGYLGDNANIPPQVSVTNGEFIRIGDNARIHGPSWLCCYTSAGGVALSPSLTIGDNFFCGEYSTICCADQVTIGNEVTIGAELFITDSNHGTDPNALNYINTPLAIKPVTIDDGVWLGRRVTVLPGVHIGEKAVIGAGSVVTRDIPPYTIAAGNPCRVVKKWDGKCWVRV